ALVFGGQTPLQSHVGNRLPASPNGEKHFLSWFENLQQSDDLISSPDQALNVMDFERVARKVIPPAHWGYLATGVDDDATVRANRDGYSHVQISARRLVDVTSIDTSRTIFSTHRYTPIVISPVGSQRTYQTPVK